MSSREFFAARRALNEKGRADLRELHALETALDADRAQLMAINAVSAGADAGDEGLRDTMDAISTALETLRTRQRTIDRQLAVAAATDTSGLPPPGDGSSDSGSDTDGGGVAPTFEELYAEWDDVRVRCGR